MGSKKVDQVSLELTWSLPLGADGKDGASDNPLSRATANLFHLGRPSQRICQCYFRGPDEVLRWLGVFVLSQGDRVLFFPGFKVLHEHVVGKSHSKEWNMPFVIDHLSLEPGRDSWHMTSPRSAEHLGKLKTRSLANGCTHWFSASVESVDQLRVLQKETVVSAAVSEADVDRRAQIFRSMADNAVAQIVELNSQYELDATSSFLHFSVLVGPAGFVSPSTQLLGLPYGGELASQKPVDWDGQAPIRIHRVPLSTTVDLEIIASQHPGQLSMPVVFGC